ncbi:MAG: phosphoribosylformylglycinamidine synthase subunit PurQ [Pseudomonadota bacterium]
MRAGVIRFPGTNRESDMAYALELATGRAPDMLWYTDRDIPQLDLLVLPGGFSYGDYLRAGAIAARAPIMRAVRDHAAQGRLVLGVCNGFQILTEAGLLPGALIRNASLTFVCRIQALKVATSKTPFTGGLAVGDVLKVPLAHHDGNYTADADLLASLEDNDQIVFQYCDIDGTVTVPANPNGSTSSIAGIVNERRNVLGLMPHPENRVDNAQGGTDGFRLFESIAHRVAA